MLLLELKKVSHKTAGVPRPFSSSQLSIVLVQIEQLSRDLPLSLSSSNVDALPHWLVAECHQFNVQLGELISLDMTALHSMMKGSLALEDHAMERVHSLLGSEVPVAWRRRFPQIVSSNVNQWIRDISAIRQELQRILTSFENGCADSEIDGGLRLGLLFRPKLVLSWLVGKLSSHLASQSVEVSAICLLLVSTIPTF